MMDGWYGGMGTGAWILMTVFWVLLVAVILFAATRVFPRSASTGRRDATRHETDPRAILGLRMARGEIDSDTYDELREKLEQPRHEAHPVGG